jgi:hypothetical protein
MPEIQGRLWASNGIIPGKFIMYFFYLNAGFARGENIYHDV